MRAAVWILVTLAGLACGRRSLQEDARGTGSIDVDAATNPADGGPGPTDAVVPVTDAFVPATDVATGRCGQTSITGMRPPPIEILLVLDQSVAGDQPRWLDVKRSIIDQINANDDRFDWGLYVFPKAGPVCDASTITVGADLSLGIGVPTHLTAHVFAAAVDGNGSPTAAAIAAGAAYLGTRVNDSPRFLMLVTDGAPTCAGTTGALSADAALAQTDAVAAITAAYSAGFATLVVAPSNAADVAALNALAQAGRYPRTGDINYFTEATLSELFVPAGDTVGCTFALQGSPPVADDVTVAANGLIVPRDRSHMSGWDYASPDLTAIQIYGTWCEFLLSSQSFRIDVFYGCPTF